LKCLLRIFPLVAKVPEIFQPSTCRVPIKWFLIKRKACKPDDEGDGKEFNYTIDVATECTYIYDKADR